MPAPVPLLIVGAGPFGLAMSAWGRRRGVDHVILGRPMGFWIDHMPAGMLLRSASDWHLDPDDELTIERHARERGRAAEDVEPLTLARYLEYAEWFRREAGIEPRPGLVTRLERDDAADTFTARLDDGSAVEARRVLLAPGFREFAHVPPELRALLPEGRWEHTCDRVDLAALRGRRVAIVGGRQSAFEWAALLREAGAARVDLIYRHPTPRFEPSDWSWVTPLMERFVDDPGWFGRLSEGEREALERRFWEEGRLKLEPWLAPRVLTDGVRLWPERALAACEPAADGMRLTLDGGETLVADHAILATGYRPDLARIPYLAAGGLLSRIEVLEGCPRLDDAFRTSVPGLHITSMPATGDFGAFFAFTVSVRASARIVGRAIEA